MSHRSLRRHLRIRAVGTPLSFRASVRPRDCQGCATVRTRSHAEHHLAVPFDSLSDAELIVRIGERDRDAFDVLYGRFARSVLGLARAGSTIGSAPRKRRRRTPSPRSGAARGPTVPSVGPARPGSMPLPATRSQTAHARVSTQSPMSPTHRRTRRAPRNTPSTSECVRACTPRSRRSHRSSGR